VDEEKFCFDAKFIFVSYKSGLVDFTPPAKTNSRCSQSCSTSLCKQTQNVVVLMSLGTKPVS
jgi:hypothetical protein